MAKSRLNNKITDIKTLLSTLDFNQFERLNREAMEQLKNNYTRDDLKEFYIQYKLKGDFKDEIIDIDKELENTALSIIALQEKSLNENNNFDSLNLINWLVEQSKKHEESIENDIKILDKEAEEVKKVLDKETQKDSVRYSYILSNYVKIQKIKGDFILSNSKISNLTCRSIKDVANASEITAKTRAENERNFFENVKNFASIRKKEFKELNIIVKEDKN